MKEWAILPTISAAMPFQMALDEILLNRLKTEIASSAVCLLAMTSQRGLQKTLSLRGTGRDFSAKTEAISNLPKPILRFYFSAGTWVTVGYSEKNSAPLKNGMKICRRITGGGRVLHGKDLIFSLIASKEHDESFRSVRLSYLKIHEAVKAGLESLGLRPRFYRCDENLPKGADCFRFPIATDLGLGEQKIAGGAQKRSARALLHEESVRLIRGLEPEQLIQAIRRGIEKIFGVHLAAEDIDPELMKEAGELSRSRYEVEAVSYKQ